MKLTELRIARTDIWDKSSPLRASVKLESHNSTIECLLSEHTLQRLLDLCIDEIAANAQSNVEDFVNTVREMHPLLSAPEQEELPL